MVSNEHSARSFDFRKFCHILRLRLSCTALCFTPFLLTVDEVQITQGILRSTAGREFLPEGATRADYSAATKSNSRWGKQARNIKFL